MRTLFFGSILGGAVSAVLARRLADLRYRRLLAARHGRALAAFGGRPCTQESCATGDKETVERMTDGRPPAKSPASAAAQIRPKAEERAVDFFLYQEEKSVDDEPVIVRTGDLEHEFKVEIGFLELEVVAYSGDLKIVGYAHFGHGGRTSSRRSSDHLRHLNDPKLTLSRASIYRRGQRRADRDGAVRRDQPRPGRRRLRARHPRRRRGRADAAPADAAPADAGPTDAGPAGR